MNTNNFEKIYEEGKIKGYEKELISDGICKSFIPASFIREEDLIKVIYNYDGYMRLDELELDNSETLEVFGYILDKIEDAADLLVDYSRLSFDKDNLFYNRENKDVRMGFVLSDDKSSFNERLSILLRELKEKSSEDAGYLDRLISAISRENISISGIRERLSKLKIELRRIG